MHAGGPGGGGDDVGEGSVTRLSPWWSRSPQPPLIALSPSSGHVLLPPATCHGNVPQTTFVTCPHPSSPSMHHSPPGAACCGWLGRGSSRCLHSVRSPPVRNSWMQVRPHKARHRFPAGLRLTPRVVILEAAAPQHTDMGVCIVYSNCTLGTYSAQ